MKESDFFKQLNRELQDAAPPLSERLKEEPICSALREKSGDGRDSRTRGKTAWRVSKKRLTAILASAAALILVCIVGLTAFFLGPSVSPTVYACMYIDINPSLALTLDENYNVRKVVSRNADADTLIREFRAAGYRILSAGIRDSVSVFDGEFPYPVLLVVGGEKRGISRQLLEASDGIVRVDYGREFRGSLSASAACAVLAFEIFRQNRSRKKG